MSGERRWPEIECWRSDEYGFGGIAHETGVRLSHCDYETYLPASLLDSYKKRAEELERALRHIQHSASFEGWSAITGSDALGVCEGIANLASAALTEQEKGEH